MKLIVKIENKNTKKLQERLFKTLGDKIQFQYGELLLYSGI